MSDFKERDSNENEFSFFVLCACQGANCIFFSQLQCQACSFVAKRNYYVQSDGEDKRLNSWAVCSCNFFEPVGNGVCSLYSNKAERRNYDSRRHDDHVINHIRWCRQS